MDEPFRDIYIVALSECFEIPIITDLLKLQHDSTLMTVGEHRCEGRSRVISVLRYTCTFIHRDGKAQSDRGSAKHICIWMVLRGYRNFNFRLEPCRNPSTGNDSFFHGINRSCFANILVEVLHEPSQVKIL